MCPHKEESKAHETQQSLQLSWNRRLWPREVSVRLVQSQVIQTCYRLRNSWKPGSWDSKSPLCTESLVTTITSTAGVPNTENIYQKPELWNSSHTFSEPSSKYTKTGQRKREEETKQRDLCFAFASCDAKFTCVTAEKPPASFNISIKWWHGMRQDLYKAQQNS